MARFLRRYARLRALLLAVIACTLGSAGMLPVWAQLAEVEGPHVCHCSTDHHDCVCAHCGTDPDARGYRHVETLKGRCGDDEIAFGGRAIAFVLPAALAPLPAAPGAPRPASLVPTLTTRVRPRPPTPPPRSA